MHLTRCPNHHYYDMEKYDECPQCSANARLRKPPEKISAKSDNNSAEIPAAPIFSEKTVSESFAEAEEKRQTVSFTDFAEDIAESNVPVPPSPKKTAERTVMLGSADAESENGLTVGWLVCVQGTHRGESFALRPGQNFIGRSSAMDIRLTGENSVSKEFHAGIIFDPMSGNFFLVPGESHGLTYLNRTLVFSPSVLKDYDKILFGSCCCIFRSFCNQNFDWNHELGM